uniref:11-beta-hydroxysteroid dehydrogenase-like 2 n=1 Tax=Erigeron canadensis TaxID=72917 RepID=UPI001CB8FDD4|nr:11-beta-hydroxysteroid dehydrogenase-like 2 [Erigeron canadensis]
MIHIILNIIVPVFSIIFFIFWVPGFWLSNVMRRCYKSVYPEELSGKVILITGASSGIGEHLAIEFAKEGAYLALVARREKQLRLVAQNAKAMGSPDVIVLPADISKIDDCKTFVYRTIKHFGKLDYLVNNAGVSSLGFFEEQSCFHNHASVLDINFWGSVYTTHFALPYLKRNKGKIIAICSTASWFVGPRLCFYNASKAAMLSFFETLRIEVDSDIDIIVVTPGMVKTNLTLDTKLEKGNALWIPALSSSTCAKDIVNCAKRGDNYLTNPFWMKTVFLWKMLCPTVLNATMKLVFISRAPDSSSKKSNTLQPDFNLTS